MHEPWQARPKHSGSAFMFFLMLFSFAFVFLILPLAVNALTANGISLDIVFSPWFTVFTQLTGLLLPLAIWLAFKRDNLNHHLPNMKLGKSNLIYIFFISILLQPTMMLISGISTLFTPNVVADALGRSMSHPLWVVLLAFAVTPAICEELVFRGYIQSQYKHYSFKKAAIMNGLLFGIIHMNPHQFVYTFIMGVIFAYMVHYTRSIRAAILSHFILNASQVTFLHFIINMQEYANGIDPYAIAEDIIIPMGDGEVTITPEMAIIFTLVFVGILTLFTLPAVIILFRTFISHNRGRNMKYDMKQMLNTDSTHVEEVETDEPAPYDLTNDSKSEIHSLIVDPFFIGVVVLFFGFIFLTSNM